ncbi:hypothetical protein HJG44_04320 [Enterovirga sp. DB1703]|uniref:O-methyltransferase C-terminal domain-containing protein n=1 Tax=Enterovirga aerilata TaxID=2730920 RepID=A0A849I1Y7_9HYPH|nr:hypothetical protein [Enterovirga sp. DB1703]
MLQPLLEKHPGLHGTVFDLPGVIAGAKRPSRPPDICCRMDFVAGDFFSSVPAGDLYLLKHVLHDWGDDEFLEILRNCRAAMRGGGRIAIIELVLGEIGEPGPTPLMDMNMLVMASGRERSFTEYAHLLGKARFGEVRITTIHSPWAIIEASCEV